MTQFELAEMALLESPETFIAHECPPSAPAVSCINCRYKWQPSFGDTTHTCGIDPTDLHLKGIELRLVQKYPEHFI